jgi:inositol oxygenase
MFLWGDAAIGQEGNTADGKQWSLGGDTWVVGCRIPDNGVVLPHWNSCNPDQYDDRYNTRYGMYPPHCGLDHLCLAWGHDEYLYRMLVANTTSTTATTSGGNRNNNNNNNTDGGGDGGCTLPGEALDMIRYHSAYPLHDTTVNAYGHLLQLPQDEDRLEWVRLFNRFDLYTKDAATVYSVQEIDEVLWPYYRGLLVKYGLDGTLKW